MYLHCNSIELEGLSLAANVGSGSALLCGTLLVGVSGVQDNTQEHVRGGTCTGVPQKACDNNSHLYIHGTLVIDYLDCTSTETLPSATQITQY